MTGPLIFLIYYQRTTPVISEDDDTDGQSSDTSWSCVARKQLEIKFIYLNILITLMIISNDENLEYIGCSVVKCLRACAMQ